MDVASLKKVIMLFEGRTGSSLLGNLLNQHKLIGLLGEEVALLKDDGWEAQHNWISTLFDNPASLCDPRIKADIQAIGFKLKLRDTAEPEGLKKIIQERHVNIVHLTRLNVVKQTVSSIRAIDLYKSTGRYNLSNREQELMPGSAIIPLKRFQATLTWLVEANLKLKLFVDELTVPTLHLSYEELYSDYTATTNRVCSFLGFESAVFRPNLIKISSDDLRDIIENYDELREHYSGTIYEAMF